MEAHLAVHAFATLGHAGRLAVFRLLMRFAPQGVRPTEIARALGLKQNTLSHYLADLTASGLVRVRRQGRSLYHAVDLDVTEELIRYTALDVGRARPDLLAPLLHARDGGVARPAPDRDSAVDVLFICSANSARSILAEALLRDLGRGRFRAWSAGTRPNMVVNPAALDVLERNGHEIAGLRSKHVAEFQLSDSRAMDVVLTVCDAAAAQDCPPWSGQPITGHWGLPDPAVASGTQADKVLAFAQTYAALRRRIAALVALPVESLSPISLQSRIDAIGADATAKV
jgi:protein-tyrosine-phosphatase